MGATSCPIRRYKGIGKRQRQRDVAHTQSRMMTHATRIPYMLSADWGRSFAALHVSTQDSSEGRIPNNASGIANIYTDDRVTAFDIVVPHRLVNRFGHRGLMRRWRYRRWPPWHVGRGLGKLWSRRLHGCMCRIHHIVGGHGRTNNINNNAACGRHNLARRLDHRLGKRDGRTCRLGGRKLAIVLFNRHGLANEITIT